MRPLVLLRPEPGLSRSAERARALGLTVIAAPLFAIEPIAWAPPDPTCFDALMLTSANAVRHGGAGLAALRHLPVAAVGQATAEAARGAGFEVRQVGQSGAERLLASLPTGLKLLHLCGEDHYEGANQRRSIDRCVVYRAIALPAPELPALGRAVVAVHSARAGARLAALCSRPDDVRVAAISEPAALACGPGWRAVAVAESPSDRALLALAARLCQETGS